MKTVEICAGILIRSGIRDFLDDCIFREMDIQYRETKGWIDSLFTIKGADSDVDKVMRTLSNYLDD